MYSAQGAPDTNQLVLHYAPLVKRIAFHLTTKLPASVLVDDLIQNGMIGLLDAIGRFESGMGAQFETYAVQRIRGAMLDGLRENDWLPRGVRREMRRVESAIQRLEHEYGRPPSEVELADTLGMPLPEYQKLLQDARGHQLIYLEDLSGDDDEGYLDRNPSGAEPDPSSMLEDAEVRQALVAAIDRLPEREKIMMSLYYEQDLNLREIGEVLSVTESRVCQLHSQAIARLRAAMMGEGGDGEGKPLAKRRGRKPKART
jgi:RNA polymerase sigma factor FliA